MFLINTRLNKCMMKLLDKIVEHLVVAVRVVDNYLHALEFVPECYKTEKMCDKAVDAYLSTTDFAPECFMTQKICAKSVNKCYFVFDYIPDQYKTQEMCDRVVSEDPFFNSILS